MSEHGRGWIGVDLDGTLAKYDGWVGPEHIGEPVPAMLDRVNEWLDDGWVVKIVTARVSVPEQAETARAAIEDWCLRHVGRRLPVTNEKDYGMVELWDDRVVQVEPNTGRRIDAQDELRMGVYEHNRHPGNYYLLIGLVRDHHTEAESVVYSPLRVEEEWAGTARMASRTMEDFLATFSYVGMRLP
jgi:hypothetical protein